MGKGKIIFLSIIGVVCLFALSWGMGLYDLAWKRFFLPKQENIRRQVFEETQSYVHGKIQDLAKYKLEYENSTNDEKEAIRQTIILRFAEFDETKIKSATLRNFLIQTRGY